MQNLFETGLKQFYTILVVVFSGGRRSTDTRPSSDEEVEIADNWSTASQISEDPSSSLPEEGKYHLARLKD